MYQHLSLPSSHNSIQNSYLQKGHEKNRNEEQKEKPRELVQLKEQEDVDDEVDDRTGREQKQKEKRLTNPPIKTPSPIIPLQPGLIEEKPSIGQSSINADRLPSRITGRGAHVHGPGEGGLVVELLVCFVKEGGGGEGDVGEEVYGVEAGS